jgi:hypothetical protein
MDTTGADGKATYAYGSILTGTDSVTASFVDSGSHTQTSNAVSVEWTAPPDTTNPDPPTSLTVSPASPANDNDPKIKGSAEGGSTVKLYTDSTCTTPASNGSSDASGSASDFGSTGIAVHVADDSSTTFYATATDAANNTSDCSTASITYTEDSTPPAKPSGLSTVPAGPSNDNTIKVKGTSDAGTTVQLYTDSTCTTAASGGGTGSAADFASPGIDVSVPDNSVTTFYAKATDAAGNPSACSTASATYVEDSVVPGDPTFNGTSPPSPANNNDPKVKGSAATGSTVQLYTSSDCAAGTEIGSPTAAATFASPGISVHVGDDTVTTFHAIATSAAGTPSACSTDSATYTEDSTAPGKPTGLSTTPSSPANNNDPVVKGTAPAGTTVKLYTDSTCTTPASNGSSDASGSASDFGSTGIAVHVGDDSSTTFYATATDAANNTSDCSTDSTSYVEDSTKPAKPTGLTISPASPANNNDPVVKGTAPANSTVKLYTDSSCTTPASNGSSDASGSDSDFGSSGIAVHVADDSSTTFYATATDAANNTSDCSTDSATYVEDSTGPAKPSGLTISPTSPANDNSPKVKGTSDPNTTVTLYTDSSCTTPAEAATGGASTFAARRLSLVLFTPATGSASQFASPGIGVQVGDNSVTTFYAQATDAAGNPSACSTDSVSYTEDSTAPGKPTGLSTTPSSPATNNDPKVKGTSDPNTTVQLYTSSDCAAGTEIGSPTAAASFASPGISVHVDDDTVTTFYAKATDSASNPSACSTDSATYQEDSTAPSSDASSPATSGSTSIDVAYTADDPGGSGLDKVELYVKRPGDADFALADTDTTPSASGEHFTYAADQGDGDYSFYTRAYDKAGNPEDAPASPDTTTTVATPQPPAPDSKAPVITISQPTEGEAVVEGANAHPSYSCSDPGGSGMASCTGPAPSGGDLDTDKVGVHDFTVNAADKDGNKSSKTVHYRVLSRGLIVVTSKPTATLKNGHIILDTGLTGYCPLAGPDCVGIVKAHRASASETKKASLSSDRFGHSHLLIHGARSHKLVYQLGKSRSKQLERMGKIRLRLDAVLSRGTNRYARMTRFVTLKLNG